MEEFDAIAKTCLLTAALRARETARPDRLYADPYAEHFVGPDGYALLDEVIRATWPADGTPRTGPSTPDYNAIRTRFFDEYLLDAVNTHGIRQVVLAAAGMDTRAYRLDWPDGVRLYEIDMPVVLAVKQRILDDIRPQPRAQRCPVPAQLLEDGWHKLLTDAGYQPDQPSAWLIEGLLYYVDGASAHRVLRDAQALTAPGSLVACDIVNDVALTDPACRPVTDVFAGWGCPWLFGADDPEALLAEYGFSTIAEQPGSGVVDYGRWPDAVAPRSMPGIPRVFLVHGRRV